MISIKSSTLLMPNTYFLQILNMFPACEIPLGTYYWYEFISVLAWISNHMLSKVWDEITYSYANFKATILKFRNG